MVPPDGSPPDRTSEQRWPEVYASLRKLASRHLRRYSQTTLSTSTLVHEAYIRLAQSPKLEFNDLDHYIHTASQAMRWILVESARRSAQAKRGGGLSRIDFRDDLAKPEAEGAGEREELLTLMRAIRRLFELDSREGHVVVMRALGMRVDEISTALGVSERTVGRDWQHGVHWLYRELAGSES